MAIALGLDIDIGMALQGGPIHLYSPSSGAVWPLVETRTAGALTWSPDSRFIAYTGRNELRVIDVDTQRQRVLASGFEAIHDIGPVWLPDGERILYQRVCRAHPRTGRECREQHEVVVVTPGDPSDQSAIASEVVRFAEMTPGSYLFPFRVTWSPDGEYLLYLASSETETGRYVPASLVAVPVDPQGSATILSEIDGIVPHEGQPDTKAVAIQTWGRRPSEQRA